MVPDDTPELAQGFVVGALAGGVVQVADHQETRARRDQGRDGSGSSA